MGRCNISELRPGMTVTSPVKTAQGILLLPAGTVLTEKNISTMRSWGVVEAEVDADISGEQSDPLQKSRTLEAFEDTLNRQFAKVEGNPVMREIKRVVLKQKSESLRVDQ